MKILEIAAIVKHKQGVEYLAVERQVLEAIGRKPFLNTLFYAFHTASKLCLVLGMPFLHKIENLNFNVF